MPSSRTRPSAHPDRSAPTEFSRASPGATPSRCPSLGCRSCRMIHRHLRPRMHFPARRAARPPRRRRPHPLLRLPLPRPSPPPPPPPPPAPPAPPAPPPAPPAAPAPPRPAAKAAPAPARASAASPAPAAATLPLPAGAPDVLAHLGRNPTAPDAGDLLAALVQHAEAALKQRRPDHLLGVIIGIARVEDGVAEGSGARRQYGIALRRIFTKAALDALVRLLAEPMYRADAITALRRGGAAAVEVLMDMLVAAPTMPERRAAFDALRHMTEGTDQLVHALDHREWYVVRNVAELIGELGIEDAVPALARRLDHEDERVRKAVAMALAKIGTRAAVEP